MTVKNSRFLAEIFAVQNAEEARSALKAKKEQYKDSTHVVHAFIVGHEGNVLGCSDDGEPSGTSGRPVLEVLKGTSVTNVMLTVTRWFGGTKLGTGGLVKAYTESAQGVVAGIRTNELVEKTAFEVHIPYSLYDAVKKELGESGATVISEAFEADILLSGQVRSDRFAELDRRVQDLARGKVRLVAQEEKHG